MKLLPCLSHCRWNAAPCAGLLEALQSESPRSDGSTPSPTSKAEDEYAPPPEASLLADGEEEELLLPGMCWMRSFVGVVLF